MTKLYNSKNNNKVIITFTNHRRLINCNENFSLLESIELILGGITPGRTSCDNMTRNVVHMLHMY